MDFRFHFYMVIAGFIKIKLTYFVLGLDPNPLSLQRLCSGIVSEDYNSEPLENVNVFKSVHGELNILTSRDPAFAAFVRKP